MISLSQSDLGLRKSSRRADMLWEASLLHNQNNPSAPWNEFASGGVNGWTHLAVTATDHIRNLYKSLSLTWSRIPNVSFVYVKYRKIVLVITGLMVASAASAAVAVYKGYTENTEAFWTARIHERTQSPIYASDKTTLIGSIGSQQGSLAADYGFVPMQGALPETYMRGLIAMENQGLTKGGIHNICGLDIPATVKRVVVNFGAGGSTLSMQLARGLKQPDWADENYVEKIFRKFQEIGASCRLYNMLGENDFLMLYAGYAPVFQGGGTLRGLESGSRVIFDASPSELTDAQQLILAAAVRKPLSVLPKSATGVECKQVYPIHNNPDYDPIVAKANVAKANQCQVLDRALHASSILLEGARLDAARKELLDYKKNGIEPANPFQPTFSKKRLVNLSSRTAASMPDGMLAKIRTEASEEGFDMGSPLFASIDAAKQTQFHDSMIDALKQIQRNPLMRHTLCLPLFHDGKSAKFFNCGIKHDETLAADVLAVNVDVSNGGVNKLYASHPQLIESEQTIGSTAKFIILVAALAAGYEPDSMLCPRKAWDGDRPLKRVAKPEEGFDCANGTHLMTLEKATASSDNLAFYELANTLGESRLQAAAEALGLGSPANEKHLAYVLSFGAYGGKPRELISATQAMISVAYGIKTSGQAPHVLLNATPKINPVISALSKILPSQAQRDSLRQLLESPLQSGGTLAFLGDLGATAGKSGTIQASLSQSNGKKFNNGKISVIYQPTSHSLSLFYVAGPQPTIPLAHDDISIKAFLPVYTQLLKE